jgi:hypothetical protein
VWKARAPVADQEQAGGVAQPNASEPTSSAEGSLVEASPDEHLTPPDYGYFPASCVLAIDLNGRLDLPWWWWLRLTGGYTIGAVPSDPVTAKPDLFPYWVLFSGSSEGEEEGEEEDVVAYRYVATCQDTDCLSVAPLIQRDPRVPYAAIGDLVPDTVEVSDDLDRLPGSQPEPRGRHEAQGGSPKEVRDK